MTAYTDFHYSPTGSGVISGAQVLEQTEQGINGLGQYVQDNVSGAIDTANEALTTARNADSNATAALNLANSFNAQIIAANQTAGNALTTAQSAQNTANAASSLATTANNSATTALNTANAASAGVTTLTGTVNSLGNRMTAAENAINTNAGNITTLQNNLATTNANVTAAANAASSAQATATSAQSTATLARNQAYVLRYTGTTITGGGTIAYTDIDNTDNIKAGDKIIDISGAIYAIASVDTTNQTVTVGASPVINLFCDAENLIPAATDTYDLGSSSYQWNNLYAKNYYYNGVAWGLDKANQWTKTQDFVGEYQGTEYSFRYHSCFALYGTEDTVGKSGMTITKWRPGKNQGALVSTDLIQFGIDVTENEVRTQNVFNIQASGYNSNNGQFNTCSLTSKMTNCNLGSTDNKWTINGLNPGRISLPRYTASVAQDISGNMIADQYNNIKFTSNLDGWMYIDFNVSSATLLSGADYLVQSKDNSLANASHAINFVRVVGNHIFVYQPVLKNEYIILEVNFSGFSIGKAYIYPCQGTII